CFPRGLSFAPSPSGLSRLVGVSSGYVEWHDKLGSRSSSVDQCPATRSADRIDQLLPALPFHRLPARPGYRTAPVTLPCFPLNLPCHLGPGCGVVAAATRVRSCSPRQGLCLRSAWSRRAAAG